MEEINDELKIKLKSEILEEIKSKYYLNPKCNKLEVADIFNKYEKDLLEKIKWSNQSSKYSQLETIKQSIRKSVCMHFGVSSLRFIEIDDFENYRIELERFIKEYILNGK